jgi:hypothetical protein
VLDLGEAVVLGDPCGPAFHRRSLHLHGLSAVAAQQVVVVAGGRAPPVHGLALAVAQGVHQAFLGHGRQDPVGGGQRHPDVPFVQEAVQFLRADEVRQAIQCGADGQALLGDALLLDRHFRHASNLLSLPCRRVPSS